MRNPEFQFNHKVNKPHAFCKLEFKTNLTLLFLKNFTAGKNPLCLKDLYTHEGYSLWPINVKEVVDWALLFNHVINSMSCIYTDWQNHRAHLLILINVSSYSSFVSSRLYVATGNNLNVWLTCHILCKLFPGRYNTRNLDDKEPLFYTAVWKSENWLLSQTLSKSEHSIHIHSRKGTREFLQYTICYFVFQGHLQFQFGSSFVFI